jgi:hypothetical protein
LADLALPDAAPSVLPYRTVIEPGPAGAAKAILYEEVTDPKVAQTQGGTLAITGNVVWSYASGGQAGPSVVGTVTIPDRKMTVKIVIHRNTDNSLPASHLIEVNVTTPSDATAFPGKSVQSVPTMVLKSSETDHGTALTGASATVNAGYYWIALSNSQKDLAANVALFKTKSWIDIYLVYQTGQRAILTLEEGPSGIQAFTQALNAWQTG